MKRIPIGEQEISSLSTLDVKGITLPTNRYLYEDISARVFFDKAGGAFADDTEIARFSFGFFGEGGGLPYPIYMGHKDVLELENIEQVEKFKFTSAEAIECKIYVQLFEKID